MPGRAAATADRNWSVEGALMPAILSAGTRRPVPSAQPTATRRPPRDHGAVQPRRRPYSTVIAAGFDSLPASSMPITQTVLGRSAAWMVAGTRRYST